MKTKILIFLFSFGCIQLKSQNVENPSFDSIYLGGLDRIHSWITSDAWPALINDTVAPHNPNTHFVSVGLQYHELIRSAQLVYDSTFHGPFAIKVLTIPGDVKNNGTPYNGFITNGNHFYTDSIGYIDFKMGGTPFPYRPSKLRGHYKFNNSSPSLTNFGKATVLLKKYNTVLHQIDTIAYAESTTQLFASNWSAFELPLTYYSAQTPDSLVLVFESSAIGLSSTFWVDSMGFYYPQPGGIKDAVTKAESPYFYDAQNHIIYFKKSVVNQPFKLIESSGRVIKTGTTDCQQIAISDLKNGMYLLEMYPEKKQKQVFKIIK